AAAGDSRARSVVARAAGRLRLRRPVPARRPALAHPGAGAPRGAPPTSRRLLPSGPGRDGAGVSNAPVLEVVDLVKHFTLGGRLTGGRGLVHAVDGVSFTLGRGELLGLVGESGSGKSTVANCVLRLCEPTSGTIRLQGTDITHLSRRELRPLRRELHMVFQDPYSSLNPRMTVGDIVGEPLRLHGLAKGRT